MYISSEYIRSVVRTIPNWPEKGVLFRDITPIFQDPRAMRGVIDAFVQRYLGKKIDVIAGMEARGFLLGVPLAYQLNIPFIPIRKKGKLPYKTIEEEYALEYGTATMEVHIDAVKRGDRVVLIDDLIATGGTMLAGINLLKKLGGEIQEVMAIIDLPELGGSEKIRKAGVDVHIILSFEGL